MEAAATRLQTEAFTAFSEGRFDEALAKAKKMLEHAEVRYENVKRYAPRMAREVMLFKGQMQRLGTFVAADIPVAAAKLDKIVDTLEAYVQLAPAEAQSAVMNNLPADGEAISETPATDEKVE